MQYSAAGMVLAASAAGISQANVMPQTGLVPTKGSVTAKCDVLVIGGGTTGIVAAIQAGRIGAKTLIVERNSQLGGTATTAGVFFPGLFDTWGRQVIAGIGWELVRESVALNGGILPDFSKVPDRHWENQVRVNQFLYALLTEEKCEQAGVRIAYYEFPQAITKTTDGWHVDCAGLRTQRRVLCKRIIDCTGDAEVVGILNLPRLRGFETQPELDSETTLDATGFHNLTSDSNTQSRLAMLAVMVGMLVYSRRKKWI